MSGQTSIPQFEQEDFIVSTTSIHHLSKLRDLYKMFNVKVTGSIDDDFEARVESFGSIINTQAS